MQSSRSGQNKNEGLKDNEVKQKHQLKNWKNK